MRYFITTILAAITITTAAQTFTMINNDIVVVQINASWNNNNTRTDLEKLKGCEYRFGWIDDQPEALQKSIASLPVVVIYRNGRPAYQYAADLSFRLDTPFEEIQEQVYKLKY